MKRPTTTRRSMAAIFAAAAYFVAAAARAESPAFFPSVADEADEHSREEWLERVEDARRRYEAFAARAGANLGSSVEDSANEQAVSPSYLYDDTMRAGDVVATRDGLLMFKGSRSFPYDPRDFERVGEGLATPAPHKSVLLELLRAGAIRGR